MPSNLWTDREVNYFRQGLSDFEIMQKTGRSAAAVLKKRRRLTDTTEGREEDEVVPPCLLMTQEEKEDRIHKLAERYGAKLL